MIEFGTITRLHSTLHFCLLLASMFLPAGVTFAASDPDITEAVVHLQIVDIDLDFEGTPRKTQVGSFEIEVRESLASYLDGRVLFGYLGTEQNTNPILAGQTTTGGYLGFSLNFHIINTQPFKLDTLLDYRYAQTSGKVADQSVDWNWHQTRLGLVTETDITNTVSLILGGYYLNINGVEKARGTLDQNIDFKAKDSLTGHIELQLKLDQSGQIGFAYFAGPVQGGRISFRRSF